MPCKQEIKPQYTNTMKYYIFNRNLMKTCTKLMFKCICNDSKLKKKSHTHKATEHKVIPFIKVNEDHKSEARRI